MPTSKSSSKSKSRSGSGSPKRSMYRNKSIIELTEGKLTLGKKKELERRQDKLIEKYPIKATEIGLAFDVPKSNTSYDVKNDRIKVKGTFPDDEVYFSDDSVFLPTKINEANLDYINRRATNQEDDFRYEVEKDYDFKVFFDNYGYDKATVVDILTGVYPAVDKKLIESVVDKEYKAYQFDKKADKQIESESEQSGKNLSNNVSFWIKRGRERKYSKITDVDEIINATIGNGKDTYLYQLDKDITKEDANKELLLHEKTMFRKRGALIGDEATEFLLKSEAKNLWIPDAYGSVKTKEFEQILLQDDGYKKTQEKYQQDQIERDKIKTSSKFVSISKK